MPIQPVDSGTSKAVPLAFAGKWIAWSADHTRIEASSDRLPDLWRLVNDRQIKDPIFEKVPRADVRFVGMR